MTTLSDLTAVADLHHEMLPHGFFARLGRRYLRAYHRTYLTSPGAAAYVACRGATVVGFVVGVTDPAAHRRHVIRRNGLRLARAGVFALFARPRLLAYFARTRLGRYARGVLCAARPQPVPAAGGTSDRSAVLTHVAVDPRAHGGGVGRLLVDAFTTAASAAGCQQVELITLQGDAGAAGFYQRLGWTLDPAAREREGAVYLRFVRSA